jgi:hypothetical protein
MAGKKTRKKVAPPSATTTGISTKKRALSITSGPGTPTTGGSASTGPNKQPKTHHTYPPIPSAPTIPVLSPASTIPVPTVSTSSNPIQAQNIPSRKRKASMRRMDEDSDTEKEIKYTQPKGGIDFENAIIELGNQAKQDWFNKGAKGKGAKADESSDSEQEALTEGTEGEEWRREYKANDLAKLAKSIFASTPEELDYFNKLQKSKETDRKKNAGKNPVYEEDTQKMLRHIGYHFRKTTPWDNQYVRRAMRKLGENDVKEGNKSNVKNYDNKQGKVRDELLKQIADDHTEHKFTREDFDSDQTWNAVQFILKNGFSNSSTEQTYYDAFSKNQSTDDTVARAAWHHILWKESKDGKFREFALTPPLLTLLNDIRKVRNAKKLKQITVNPTGNHETFGHEAQASSKNIFKDLDPEAVYYVMQGAVQPRTPKKQLLANYKKRKLSPPTIGGSIGNTATSATVTNAAPLSTVPVNATVVNTIPSNSMPISSTLMNITPTNSTPTIATQINTPKSITRSKRKSTPPKRYQKNQGLSINS